VREFSVPLHHRASWGVTLAILCWSSHACVPRVKLEFFNATSRTFLVHGVGETCGLAPGGLCQLWLAPITFVEELGELVDAMELHLVAPGADWDHPISPQPEPFPLTPDDRPDSE
jgi:hypothetical protein